MNGYLDAQIQGTRYSTTPISSLLSKGHSGEIYKCSNHVLNGPEATSEGRSLTPPTPAPPCSSLSPTHNNTPTDHRKSTTNPSENKTLYYTKCHSVHSPTLRPYGHTCSHLTCLMGYTHTISTQSPTFRFPVVCLLASPYNQVHRGYLPH